MSGGARSLLWVLLLALHLPGLAHEPQQVEFRGDAHYFYSHEEAARRTLLEHGQLPVWNPWACGGIPGLANPQATYLAPDFLLRLLFGTGPGRRLAVLLFFFLGLEGMFLLGRRLGLEPLPAVLAAVIFAFCGRYTQAVTNGWLNMMPFQLLPWVALAFEEGRRSLRWTAAGGIFLAWMLLCGGTYTFPYAAMLLGLGVALRLASRLPGGGLRERKTWRPLRVLAGMLGVALLLSAVRALPVLALVQELPRPVETLPVFGADVLFEQLWRSGQGRVPDLDFAYVGPIALGLPLLARDRRVLLALAGGGLFFLLALGDIGSLAPYHLLAKLPVYGQLRASNRLLILVVFCLALAAGYGLQGAARLPGALRRFGYWRARMPEALARRLGRGLALGVAGLVGVQLIASNGITSGRAHDQPPPLEDPAAAFMQVRGNRWEPHLFPPLNQGVLACFEESPFPQSLLLRADLPAEEYPADPALATVKRAHWSPHRIELLVQARTPTRVLLNQNHHRNWRAEPGRVVDHQGLLAVEVPAGRHHLVLVHHDPLVFWAGLISLATALGLLLFFGLGTTRRPRGSRASRETR